MLLYNQRLATLLRQALSVNSLIVLLYEATMNLTRQAGDASY